MFARADVVLARAEIELVVARANFVGRALPTDVRSLLRGLD